MRRLGLIISVLLPLVFRTASAETPLIPIVLFDWDSAAINGSARDQIQMAASQYKYEPNLHYTLTGHSDRSGPDKYNMALSVRRARAVRDALIKGGIPADQITVVGRGESELAVPTPDGVKDPANRSVVIDMR